MSKYGDLVKINKYDLPTECAEHSSTFHAIAEAKANKQAEIDKLKAALQLHMSKEEIEIRKGWDVDKDGKQTESGITAKLNTLDSVLVRQENIREKTGELAVLDAAKAGFEHRKSMLTNLTSLLIGGFYSAPEGIKNKDKKKKSVKAQSNREEDEFDD